MNTDDILRYRNTLSHFDLEVPVPESTVYATDEWMATIAEMATQIPIVDDGLTWPTHAEMGWSWADTGVLLVFETPQVMEHVIISDNGHPIEPEIERMVTEAMVFTPEQLHSAVVHDDDGEMVGPHDPVLITIVLYLAAPEAVAADYLSTIRPTRYRGDGHQKIPMSAAYVMQNQRVWAKGRGFSQSTRYLYAMFWAMGHPMTTHAPMPAARPALRRWARTKLPPVRMLTLTAPPSETTDGERPVDWQRSWKVRTHWRNQACGPKMRQHKRILVHEYWKQTHLVPDTRPTVWQAE